MLHPRRLQRLLATALLASAASLALAADEGSDTEALVWLERMQSALRERDYSGEFSFYRDGQLNSLSITHGRVDGELRERLVHLDGPRRVIVRNGEVVSCLLEEGDPMLDHLERVPAGPFARAFIPGDGADGSMLPSGYESRISGAGRVAGQMVRRIDVLPDDATRYGYRLYLQDPTALPLRAELLDPAGAALEIFQFVRIDLRPDLARLLDGPVAPGLVRHDLDIQASAEADDAPMDWSVEWLPTGFEMAAASLSAAPMRDAPVQTLSYSDGIASLSVFVERAWSDTAWTRQRRQGATSAVMRELENEDGARFLVTVVGEVPMATAERVAAAVRPMP